MSFSSLCRALQVHKVIGANVLKGIACCERIYVSRQIKLGWYLQNSRLFTECMFFDKVRALNWLGELYLWPIKLLMKLYLMRKSETTWLTYFQKQHKILLAKYFYKKIQHHQILLSLFSTHCSDSVCFHHQIMAWQKNCASVNLS